MIRPTEARAVACALLPAAVLAVAFHGSWRWLFERTKGAPEEAATLAVMVAVVLVAVWRRVAAGHAPEPPPLLPCIAALALWTVLVFGGAPRIVAAALSAVTTLAALWWVGFGRRPSAAFIALASLVLPWVPTLQFYFGYPMRIVCSMLTLPLLWASGRAVTLEGTALVFEGQRVEFDAPCSGVAMAWAASLLVLAAATLADLDWRRTLKLVLVGLKLVALANVLRAAALFHLETGLVATPVAAETMHSLVGITAFGAATLAIARMLRRATA